MRRILLGILIGLLAFGAGAAGAKVVTVTNPMSGDLNANAYSITNVAELQAANAELGQNPGNFGALLLRDGSTDTSPGGLVAVIAGTDDPSSGFIGPVVPGSLYLRHNGTSGQEWLKNGSANTAWACVAGCAP